MFNQNVLHTQFFLVISESFPLYDLQLQSQLKCGLYTFQADSEGLLEDITASLPFHVVEEMKHGASLQKGKT